MVIGQVEGSSADVFGRIRKVSVNRAGDFFVLDDRAFALKWFNNKGQLLGKAGRQGRGPGEFQTPTALFVDAQNRIHVYDRRNSRISVFSAGATGLVHESDLRIDQTVEDLCVLNGEYYLQMPSDSVAIRRVSRDGRLLSGIGQRVDVSELIASRLSAAPELVRSFTATYNSAIMHCDASTQRIILLYRHLPLIRAFHSSGAAIWETRLKDYHQMRHVPVPGTTAYQQAPDPRSKTVTMANSVTLISPTLLAVTLVDGGLLRGASYTRHVRVLSMENGRELARSPTTFILGGQHGKILYTHSNDPFPRIALLPIGETRGSR
jgi:hypothetical protein